MGHRSTGGQRQLRRGVGRHQLFDEPNGISQVEIPWKHGTGPTDCAGAILLQQRFILEALAWRKCACICEAGRVGLSEKRNPKP